jgi:protocatechuate 3,4-dioxygenase beta subunit
MTLRLNLATVQDGQQVPYSGAAVSVRPGDRDGKYSLYSEGLESENYLSGGQVADTNGIARLRQLIVASPSFPTARQSSRRKPSGGRSSWVDCPGGIG